MVETPVGARCKDCADIKKIPVYSVSGIYYLRAVGAGLGAGIAIGLIWGLIELYLPWNFLNLVLAAGAGWLIGEAVSRSVNRKRTIGLAFIGGFAVLIAVAIVPTMELIRLGFLNYSWTRVIFSLLGAGIGMYMAVNRLH
jgi:hypothetical protein